MLINIPTGQAARLEGSRGVKRGLGDWDRGRGRRVCLLTRAGGGGGEMKRTQKRTKEKKGRVMRHACGKWGIKTESKGVQHSPSCPNRTANSPFSSSLPFIPQSMYSLGGDSSSFLPVSYRISTPHQSQQLLPVNPATMILRPGHRKEALGAQRSPC